MKLTKEEQQAIADLQALAERWPKTLWLWSASGHLHVMRCGTDGEPVRHERLGVDPTYLVESIDIPNDGGDW